MAAVTVTNYRSNVAGSYRNPFYQINIANSGDTLVVPLRIVRSVNTSNTAVSNITTAANAGGTLLTFTTSGAVNSLLVDVLGQ